MINKLIEARLNLKLSRNELVERILVQRPELDLTSVKITIGLFERGAYKHKLDVKTADKYCFAYNMSPEEFVSEVNNNYKNKHDEEFIKELKIFSKSVSRNNDRPIDTINYAVLKPVNERSRQMLSEAMNEGFYNIADKTAYNKYCNEHSVHVTVKEWHKIKKELSKKYLETTGETEDATRYKQSLIRCANKVGFGDDYRKYARWAKYIRTHEDPMSMEEWIKFDDEKMKQRALNAASRKSKDLEQIRLDKERSLKYREKKASELGLSDAKQYDRWIMYSRQIRHAGISIEDWLEIDKVNQQRRKEYTEMTENVNI